MKTRPENFPGVFGTDFARRNSETVVQIGDKSYDKYDLGAIGCPHTPSARKLNRVLRELNITSIQDLVQNHSPRDFVEIKGFRTTAFYALTCILRDSNIRLKDFYTSKVTVDTLATNVRKANNGNGHTKKKRTR